MNVHVLILGDDFLCITPKAQAMTRKVWNKLNLRTTKNLQPSRVVTSRK